MQLKPVALALSAVLAVSTAPVRADSPHEFSANVSLTTNYKFRGITQTDNGPAIQGGFDYSYTPANLYAGVWASNVDSNLYSGANVEMDWYAGWSPSFGDLGLDLGYLYYSYPNSTFSDNNTSEFHLGATYTVGMFTPGLTVYYSPDFFGTNDAWYWDASVEVALPQDFTVSAHYGWNKFDDSSGDYEDWKIGVAKGFGGFDFDLSYVGNAGEPANSGNLFDDTFVFTVGKSF